MRPERGIMRRLLKKWLLETRATESLSKPGYVEQP